MASNIEFEIAPIDEAIDALLDTIKSVFLPDTSNEFLPPFIEIELAGLVDQFKDELYCIIEYPYVDKVYRDSYYHYFSSKHYPYQRDCIRVSLFGEAVLSEDFLNHERHEFLQSQFLGYFVLRPTIHNLFGRSIISPSAFEGINIKICSCISNCLVYGVKLNVEGFPHSSQDGESIKCAETTIWSLMEYFGIKYAEYKPALPAKIHKTLERISYQRQLPSNGLTMEQISFALKDFGFGTRIYSENAFGNGMHEIIHSYVESGIPVLIGLQSGAIGHVIIAIGTRTNLNVDWANVPKSQLNGNSEFYETANIPTRYVVQDDNLDPYRLISLDNPGEHYEDPDCQNYEIDSIVVPLYPKIYLESYIAKELAFKIVTDEYLGYDFEKDFVFRFFLTSSRSFKSHIASLSQMEQQLKNSILLTKMPKFIWISEFYNQADFDQEQPIALGIVVLDATEANQESADALIFAGYPDKCVSFNENNFVVLQQEFQNYSYFSNLK